MEVGSSHTGDTSLAAIVGPLERLTIKCVSCMSCANYPSKERSVPSDGCSRQREGHAFPSRILKFVDVRGDLAVQSPALFLVGLIRHLRKDKREGE